MRVLINHEWKGEVRELENVIERSIIFCNEDYIGVNNLPSSLVVDEEDFSLSLTNSLEDSVKKYERDIIINALHSNDFNKEKTADYLNVGLSTLYRRLKDLNIEL
jgi:DNA-binding NtrC family response regulator